MEEDPLREKAKQKAFRLLAVRARSEKELRSKLKERGYDESVVDAVAARLRELKYLDDESFARGWARNLALNRLSGNRRIEEGLREKGIERALIEQVIAEIRKELSEQKAIRALIMKKMGNSAMKIDERAKRRLARGLLGKGFPPEMVFDTVNRLKEGLVDEG